MAARHHRQPRAGALEALGHRRPARRHGHCPQGLHGQLAAAGPANAARRQAALGHLVQHVVVLLAGELLRAKADVMLGDGESEWSLVSDMFIDIFFHISSEDLFWA